MFILNAYEQTVECNKAIKGSDYIHCYKNSMIIAEFNGITDFAGYSLTDLNGNSAMFAAPEPTEFDRLRALESAMLTMMMGGAPNV